MSVSAVEPMADEEQSRPAVLLVDDRPDNLLALEALLEPLDVRLVRAYNGREALRCLLTEEFAVIILDVQMPDLDGYETARHIKARERNRRVPIIFLTAIHKAPDRELEGYGSGAIDYLAKPFAPQVLVSKVTVLVEIYQQAKVIENQNVRLAAQLAELRLAEERLARQAAELQRSNADLDRFATMAARDLREPLHLVQGYLELLERGDGAPAAAGEGLALPGKALLGVDRMHRMLDALQRYAQASFEPAKAEVALDEIVDGLAASWPVASTVITHDPLPVVIGDRRQLELVLGELTGNAVSHGRADPLEIHVGRRRQDHQWVITVHDNGEGMSKADLGRLFTLFNKGRSGQPNGVGLGLALCRRIVERHGGAIWAESMAGRGTSVSFSLPSQDGIR
jgi:signal transduction histidine kinase